MQCFNPLSLPRPNGRGSADRMEIPCGKCAACLDKRRADWAFRLRQEEKASDQSWFITLTKDEKNCNGNVDKKEVQLFLKRLRKYDNFRYFLISEYGPTTIRPHYHALIFGFKASFDRFNEILSKTWTQGYTSVTYCNNARINYVAGYMFGKSEIPEGLASNFALMSRRPGIGFNYLEKHSKEHMDHDPKFYATEEGGIKTNLPRYYVDKLYGPNEKEQNNESNRRNRDSKNSDLYTKFGPEYSNYKELEKAQYLEKFNKRKKNKTL